MTATLTLEELVRQALARLARQESRTEAIEAALRPGGGTPRGNPQDPPSASLMETPATIAWPTREIPARVAAPDRVKELETRLARAEERLNAAARLETVGRLVAGVSHDFNNLLAILTAGADVILAGLPPGDPLRETAHLIATTAQTAAGVTRQIVAFGKPSRAEPCPVDPNAAVRALERMLRRVTGERVVLDVTLAAEIPIVRADPGQFDQVLLNLVVNARDAIPGDGTITIRTAAAGEAASRPNWPAEVPPGEFVAVTVTDNGTGMTDEVKARVFDPFFTTKGERGTGLGLSIVREIVRAAGGNVEVDSAPGWGTSVRVFWPVFPEPKPPLRIAR